MVLNGTVSAVVAQTPLDMDALFEMLVQRKTEERPPGGDQLHTGTEAALNQCQITACQVFIQVMHVRTHFESWKLSKRLVAQAWSGDQDQAQVRDLALHRGESPGDFVQEMAPDRGTAYSGNGNLLVLQVPQAGAHGSGISKSRRVERQGIPTIAKVLISPTANDRESWTKGLLHHIFRIADENGRVAQVGETCDVLYIV